MVDEVIFMIKLKKIYLCDPDKNKECKKTGCLFGFGKDGYCTSTYNKKYAVIDPHNGRPILLPEFNLILVDGIDDLMEGVEANE